MDYNKELLVAERDCNVSATPTSTLLLDNLRLNLTRITCCLLITAVVITSNVLFMLTFANKERRRKWLPIIYVFRILSVIAIVSGSVNALVYVITSLAGQWVFGGVLCQTYGVFSSVSTTAWINLLVVGAFERYMKLMAPDEHDSYFSEVNTRIIVYGTMLLLLVLHLGPVYGWGEYSFYRGEIELVVQMVNATNTTTQSEVHPEAFSAVSAMFFGGVHEGLWTGSHPLLDILSTKESIHIRSPARLVNRGGVAMVLPIRVPNAPAYQVLLERYHRDCVAYQITNALNSNSSMYGSGIHSVSFLVNFTLTSLARYQHSTLDYQDSAVCALDYTSVNNNVYSFVGFSWITTLLFPAMLGAFFFITIYRQGIDQLCLLSSPHLAASNWDGHVTHVLAVTVVSSYLLLLPSYFFSLFAGLGYPIPYAVHVTGTLLAQCMPALLACVYISSSKNVSNVKLCSWLKNISSKLASCCCCCIVKKSSHNRARDAYGESSGSEALNRLLYRSSPTCSPARHATTCTPPCHDTGHARDTYLLPVECETRVRDNAATLHDDTNITCADGVSKCDTYVTVNDGQQETEQETLM